MPDAGGVSDANASRLEAPATVRVPKGLTLGSLDPLDAPRQNVARVAAPSTGNKLASLHGRCLDPHGLPLAGCRAAIRAWPVRANGGNSEPARSLHPWQDPEPSQTDADGLFLFAFEPPPDRIYTLDVTGPGRVTMTARLQPLAPGSVVDLGDVTLHPGIAVRGRIVDTLGRQRAEELLHVSGQAEFVTMGLFAPRTIVDVQSGNDGSFQLPFSAPAGEYTLRTARSELISPGFVKISAAEPLVEIVVLVQGNSAADTITGRVLDHRDQPVPHFGVHCESDGQHDEKRVTRRDGTFEFVRSNGADAVMAQLRLLSKHHDAEQLGPRSVPWGSRDVVLRLPEAPALRVVVLGSDGEPLTSYGATLMPLNPGGSEAGNPRRGGPGPHASGVTLLPGFQRGAWLLHVEFPAESGLAPWFLRFFHPGGDGEQVVRAKPFAHRSICVTTRTGEPLVAIPVRLVEVIGGIADPQALPEFAAMHWKMDAKRRKPLQVFQGFTDAVGRVTVQGVPGVEMQLQLPGPGHIPLVVPGFRCDVEAELPVVVDRGAGLRAMLRPAAALAEMLHLVQLQPDESFPDNVRPRIELHDAGGGMQTEAVAVAAWDQAGFFEARDVPPGTWLMRLCYLVGKGIVQQKTLAVGKVHLQQGQTAEVDIDVGVLIPGQVEGQILRNGKPYGNGTVNLVAGDHAVQLQTDKDGRFATRLLAGSYVISLWRPLGGNRVAILTAAEGVQVRRGEVTRGQWEVASATVDLRMVDSKGAAVPRLQLLLQDEAGRRVPLAETNSAGEVATELLVGKYRILALPKHLATEQARAQWMRQTGRGLNALASEYLEVGTLQLFAGQREQQTIPLSAEAGY